MAMKTKVHKIWDEFLDVPYISASPSTQYGFEVPKQGRADIDPRFNGQPWYKGKQFAAVDPSQLTLPMKGKK